MAAIAAFLFMAGHGALAAAQGMFGDSKKGAVFKQAPAPPEPEAEAAQDADLLLGIIHPNTAFFITIAAIAVFWFLLGGGRKAKLGRKQ